MGERIFMPYLHIHKAEHFTFKILFIHNISAQLCLLWTLLELHFTPLFQTQRIRCTLHFKQKSKRSSSPAILPREAETTYSSEGNQWVGLTTQHNISSLTYPCRKSLSNIKPLFYWNQRQWSLFKRKSTFQLWPDGAPKGLYLSKQLCGVFHTTVII